MRLTERGRWVLVYLPATMLLEGALVWGVALLAPDMLTP